MATSMGAYDTAANAVEALTHSSVGNPSGGAWVLNAVPYETLASRWRRHGAVSRRLRGRFDALQGRDLVFARDERTVRAEVKMQKVKLKVVTFDVPDGVALPEKYKNGRVE